MPVIDPAHIVLAVLALSILLFITDAVRYDVIAVGVAVALAASGCLTPAEAFRGFSSPAVMLIASMYVFSGALRRWGVAEMLGQKLLSAGAKGERGLIFRVAAISGLLSSVLSNTGVVAIQIPILSNLARKFSIPVSRLLIPLSYGALIGGLGTLIGTSKNLAVNDIIRSCGGRPFDLFEFSHFGVMLVAVTALYFLGPGRRLLPARRTDESLSEHFQVRKFVTEVLIEPTSTLINRPMGDTRFFGGYGVNVLGIVRPDSPTILAPGPYNRVRREDTLILQGEPDALMRLRKDLGLALIDSAQVGETRIHSDDVQLVEGVVHATSPLVGRTLVEAEFRANSGLNVLGLSQEGQVRPARANDARLHVGDSLLVQGHARDLDRARRDGQLLILGEHDLPSLGRGALLTILLLLAVLVAAALKLLALPVAAVSGALLLVLLRCIDAEDIYNSMDWVALVLIGGMLSLGLAFQQSGLAATVGQHIADLVRSAESPHLMIAAFLITTMLLTTLTTHIASAVIMAPIALSTAAELGVNDRTFLMAVLCGASLAFMSPVAHPANAMVVGPGDYRYRHFLKAGAPLAAILLVFAVIVLPILWPLTPL